MNSEGYNRFIDFYSSAWGPRWEHLFEALKKHEARVARTNFFSQASPTNESTVHQGGEIPRGDDGLLLYYVMDPASIVAAKALQVQPGDRVLDMCAAPGGKSLILAEKIFEEGELICNETSAARRERLTKVIQQYISRDVRNRIWVTGKDGGKFALTEKEGFDRILVDAPCSGERHLLENSSELNQWKKSRSEQLAQRQYALLTAALIATRPGGRIVYSTCSISPLENDQVIERLLKKKKGDFVVIQDEKYEGPVEKTEQGFQYLPDTDGGGWGPIYFSVLQKTPS